MFFCGPIHLSVVLLVSEFVSSLELIEIFFHLHYLWRWFEFVSPWFTSILEVVSILAVGSLNQESVTSLTTSPPQELSDPRNELGEDLRS